MKINYKDVKKLCNKNEYIYYVVKFIIKKMVRIK